jgi:hypothetical protein
VGDLAVGMVKQLGEHVRCRVVVVIGLLGGKEPGKQGCRAVEQRRIVSEELDQSYPQRPGRKDEPDDQGSHGQALPL